VRDGSFTLPDALAGAAGRDHEGKAREYREYGLEHFNLLDGQLSLLHLRNHSHCSLLTPEYYGKS